MKLMEKKINKFKIWCTTLQKITQSVIVKIRYIVVLNCEEKLVEKYNELTILHK